MAFFLFIFFYLYHTDTSQLCAEDLEKLAAWTQLFTSSDEELLTERGRKEMQELGSRMASRMMQVFLNALVHDKISVESVSANKCVESARQYLQGSVGYWPFQPKINQTQNDQDFLLNFVNNCDRFLIVR
jgi:hypothetical protein